ncbi:MAG: hypothetical protein ACKERG_02630 [Candidatus Hodgkinia cicadicola]
MIAASGAIYDSITRGKLRKCDYAVLHMVEKWGGEGGKRETCGKAEAGDGVKGGWVGG